LFLLLLIFGSITNYYYLLIITTTPDHKLAASSQTNPKSIQPKLPLLKTFSKILGKPCTLLVPQFPTY